MYFKMYLGQSEADYRCEHLPWKELLSWRSRSPSEENLHVKGSSFCFHSLLQKYLTPTGNVKSVFLMELTTSKMCVNTSITSFIPSTKRRGALEGNRHLRRDTTEAAAWVSWRTRSVYSLIKATLYFISWGDSWRILPSTGRQEAKREDTVFKSSAEETADIFR